MNIPGQSQQYDCLVIGAGIIGLMTARVLVRAGLKTAVLEKGTIGMECSWAGGGILSPLYPWRESEVHRSLIHHSHNLYPLLSAELHSDTGIDPEWHQSGMLVFGIDFEEVNQIHSWALKQNIEFEIVSDDQLTAMLPVGCNDLNQAVYLPEITQIRNPRLLQALRKSLENNGVDLYENTEVKRLVLKNHGVNYVESVRGNFRADIIVLANGAWGSFLLTEMRIKPVRGQMICYLGCPGYLQHIVLKDGFYIIPRRDGHLLVGSTVEDVGFDKGTTDNARDVLCHVAGELLPGISKFPLVGHWSGLRPATHTNTPYICAHPEIDGLYLNIGHYRNGLLLAPASAEILADIILKRDVTANTDCFRFQPETPVSC
jgi:glycine oxidase